MKITSVKVRKIEKEDSRMKGKASVVLDDCFAIKDIRIIQGDDKLFIAMPSRKLANGEYSDVAHPINSETRKMFEDAIIDSYKFLKLYDKLIIKECFNDQIYKNLDGDSKRMLKFNIEEINISLSYIKNSISSDSRSYFGTLNQNSYEKVNSSYTTLFNLYSNTVNIFYDLVNSYYNGGVIND